MIDTDRIQTPLRKRKVLNRKPDNIPNPTRKEVKSGGEVQRGVAVEEGSRVAGGLGGGEEVVGGAAGCWLVRVLGIWQGSVGIRVIQRSA
jgi:hypothetical protein